MRRPTMLIATGMIDSTAFTEEYPSIDIKVVESVLDAMNTLQANSNTYDYILISGTSFAITGGSTNMEAMKALADILHRCLFKRFLLLDLKDNLELEYNSCMQEIKGKFRKSIQGNITLRTYAGAIKKMMEDSLQPEVTVIPDDKVEKKVKENIFSIMSKKKNQLASNLPVKSKKEEQVELDKPKNLEIKEEVKVEPEIPDVTETVVKSPEPLEKPKKKLEFGRFKRRSVLFTSPCRKVGTTTTAMSFSKLLADSGMTVCFVQVTEGVYTFTSYIKDDHYIEQIKKNPFSSEIFLKNESFEDIVGIVDNVHYICNEPYSVGKVNFNILSKVMNNANRRFDCVVYDISFDIIKNNPEIISMINFKNIVLTNTIDCISEVAYAYEEIKDRSEDNPSLYVLSNSMLNTFNFVISRVDEERMSSSGEKIDKDKVVMAIVDVNDDYLVDLEFLPVVSVIPENSSVFNNPLSKKASHFLRDAVNKMEG